jgi:hypothetical protein
MQSAEGSNGLRGNSEGQTFYCGIVCVSRRNFPLSIRYLSTHSMRRLAANSASNSASHRHLRQPRIHNQILPGDAFAVVAGEEQGGFGDVN